MVIDETMTHASRAILSLQHLHRVKSLISVGQIACVTCYITDQVSSKLVSEIWKSYVAEIEHGQGFSDRLLILQVKALPRQAIVEWGGLTYEKIIDMYADESDESSTRRFSNTGGWRPGTDYGLNFLFHLKNGSDSV